ncbi:MAG: protein tyrosine/serine phosphatase [Patiriisocius sp.]|jgi:protein tyrosine/serine phosphatase
MQQGSDTDNGQKRALALALVLILASYLGFEHVIKDRILPKRWGEVESGLVFRSGQLHPALVSETLKRNGVEKIIDLQYWEEKPGLIAEREAAATLQIEIARFPLNGNGTGDVNHYVEAMIALHQARKNGVPVLIHCAAGSQRTGGVLAAYRTLVLGLTAEEAVTEMGAFDWQPKKDQVLLDYLNTNIGYIAEQLVLNDVISHVPALLPYFNNPLEASAD